MRAHRITLPELGLFAGTRALIGLGAGLLLADKLRFDQRRAAGIALLATGLLSSVPLGFLLFRARENQEKTATRPIAATDAPTSAMPMARR